MVKPVMPHSSTKSHIDAGCGCSGDPSYKTKVVPRKKCRGFLNYATFGQIRSKKIKMDQVDYLLQIR